MGWLKKKLITDKKERQRLPVPKFKVGDAVDPVGYEPGVVIRVHARKTVTYDVRVESGRVYTGVAEYRMTSPPYVSHTSSHMGG